MENQLENKSSTSFLNAVNFIEKGGSKAPSTPLDFKEASNPSPETSPSPRILSSQRMKYSAEVELIKKKWGSLEDMRRHLHLSQRKMAQLLMVDPSAWTRWTKEDGQAPPHIYRSLSWFLMLQDQNPDLRPQHWLSGVARPSIPEQDVSHLKSRLNSELRGSLEHELKISLEKRLKIWKWMWIGQLFALVILAGLCMQLVQKS